MNQLNRAMQIVTIAHVDQYDKQDRPYFMHCVEVMQNATLRYENTGYFNNPEIWNILTLEDVQIVALLHDVMEDQPKYTPRILKTYGFTDLQIKALAYLNKNKFRTYSGYINSLCKTVDTEVESLSVLVLMVKLADNHVNRNGNVLTDSKKKEYEDAYNLLDHAFKKLVYPTVKEVGYV